MGSALIYYQKEAKIKDILGSISEDKESNGMLEIRAVDSEEADSVIASFNNKGSETE